jgi:hypothetical protein
MNNLQHPARLERAHKGLFLGDAISGSPKKQQVQNEKVGMVGGTGHHVKLIDWLQRREG